MKRACVLGSANLDLRFTIDTRALPVDWDSEVYADRADWAIAGKGFGTARTLAWLGHEVDLLAPRSPQWPGPDVERAIHRAASMLSGAGEGDAGALKPLLQDATGPAGVVGALVDSEDNPVYFTRNGRDHWSGISLTPTWSESISAADIFLTGFEAPMALVEKAIDIAQAASVPVLLAASPVARSNEDRKTARHLVDRVDMLVLSESEVRDLRFRSDDHRYTPAEAFRRLRPTSGTQRAITLVMQRGGRFDAVATESSGESDQFDDGLLGSGHDGVAVQSTLVAGLVDARLRGMSAADSVRAGTALGARRNPPWATPVGLE